MPEFTAGSVSATAAPGEVWVGARGYPVVLGGATDNYQVLQQALNDAGAAPGKEAVRLPAGVVGLGKWLSVPAGVRVYGAKGSTGSASDRDSDWGTVIKPLASFSGSGSPSYTISLGTTGTTPPAVFVLDGVSGGSCDGVQLADFWVDGGNLPTGSAVDGIAGIGQARSLSIDRVGIFSMPGRGVSAYQVTVSSVVYSPDAWQLLRVLASINRRDGLWGRFSDTTAVGCHASGNGVSGTGDGLYVCGSNNRWEACRFDQNQNGATVDAPGGSGGFADGNTFVGSGSQRNAKHGLYVTNSSAGGASARAPVEVAGGYWSGDGASSATSTPHYAGVRVEGRNTVHLVGSSTTVATVDQANGCPAHSLSVGKTAGGTTDPVVSWDSGILNYADPGLVTGSAAVYDPDAIVPRVGAGCSSAKGYSVNATTAPTPWLAGAWQPIGAGVGYTGSWADSGSSDPGAWRYIAESNEVEVIADLSTPMAATPQVLFAGTSVIFTLPVQYRPSTLHNFEPVIVNVVGAPAAQVLSPRVFVSTAGAFTATAIPGQNSATAYASRIVLRARVSLDF